MAALSTTKILQTMEWAKKLNFGRSSALGNFIEPAITSANIILQTILGPPFEWWWNNQTLSLITNPNTTPATITNTVLNANVATYTTQAAHNFNAGQLVIVIGSTNGAGVFNVMNAIIASVPSATTFTVAIQSGNVGSAVDTGTATVNPQDYAVAASQFGRIENASVQTLGASANWMQLEVKNSLALDSTLGRPRFIAPHNQDQLGNVTFRIMPAPDKAYPVSVHIQQAAQLISSVNSSWAPLPDFMGYIYNWGFLAMMYMFADDPRFATANQKFIAHLLSAAEGLDEQQKNIFLNNWNNTTATRQQRMQQGIQATGV
jgi:hypothetical protein